MWLEEHLRHRSGFGVHSPMLYRVVREAMMPRKVKGEGQELYNALRAVGVDRRSAVRLQNLFTLEGYTAWKIDEPAAKGQLAIATLRATTQCVEQMAAECRTTPHSTLCILHPIGSLARRRVCRSLVKGHPSMSASKPAFTLFFSRPDLKKQHIVI